MKNLNLLFHKLYYGQISCVAENPSNETKKIFEDDVKARNNEIFASKFVHSLDFLKCEIPNVSVFRMKTKYPGLLIGTGYPHGSGRADDDIKCGFSFDYVSGQPYIPGSSVKGVLRSHFKDRSEAIAAIANISLDTVKALEANIFDCGDTFLDAVLYDGDEKNHMLGNEYLTPHSDTMKNPIPIHIMKVLPDVRFEFRFLVSDFTEDGFTFTGKQKLELFKTLLELFGTGAKTNVGFGVLEIDESAPKPCFDQQNTQSNHGRNNSRNNHNSGYNNNRGNVYDNNNHRNNENYTAGTKAPSTQEKVKCPHCGWINYKYNKQGKKCSNHNCGKDLP